MFDMLGIMGKVKEFQARMKTAQETLGSLTETTVRDGIFVAINGHKHITRLEIHPDYLHPQKAEMLQEQLMLAINTANKQMEATAAEHIRAATEGLLPNIPGMDLAKMMQ